MDNNQSLPNGFVTIERAIEVINSDTRKDAKVDTQYLVSHLKWIEEAHNFRIPLLRNATPEEIEEMRKNPRLKGRVRSTVPNGDLYVEVDTVYHAEMLKEAIKSHYRDMVGQDYQPTNTRGISTVADEEETGGAVKVRANTPTTKEGADITSGSSVSAKEIV